MSVGSTGSGTGGAVLGSATSVAGVATLPNTGGNQWVQYLAILAIALGGIIVLSSIARILLVRGRQ